MTKPTRRLPAELRTVIFRDMGIVRPRQPGENDHTVARDAGHNPYPDVVAFLSSKGQGVVDWARKTFPTVAADHVSMFARTRDPKHLASLTELEKTMLRDEIERQGGKFKTF